MFAIITFSCSDTNRPDGDWDDNIKLSDRTVELTAQNDSVLITTEGEGWWISDIAFNGSQVDLGEMNTNTANFVINEAEFRMERKNATEIYVEMTENQTTKERGLSIGLQSGDYFDRIEITQAAN